MIPTVRFPIAFGAAFACTLCVAAHAADSARATGTVERAAPTEAAAQPAPASASPAAKPGSAAKPAAGTKSVGTRGGSGRAVDRLELDATAITGNRELPKVMVVVPWKKSDIGDLVGKPVNSLIDEALQPVDREVFRREIDYYGALGPDRPRGETPVTDAAVKAPPEK